MIDTVLRADALGKGDRAIERNPAHELRVDEVTRLASNLPDAVIGFLPLGGRAVGQVRQQPLRRLTQAVNLIRQAQRGVEELAVDVELALVPRAVADPYWPAVAPAAEVGQLAFGEVTFAADAEHDLEVEAAADLRCRGVRHELEELVGFVRACRDPQRLEREARVADPRVAVVPVARAARRLGK